MNYKFQLPNNHNREVVDELRANASIVGAESFVIFLIFDIEGIGTDFYYQINIYGLEAEAATFLALKYNLAVVSEVPDAQII